MKDYYKILQIHPEASQEVLNTAYRTLVRQYHPDVYHTRLKSRMTEKMQEINEAYQVLSSEPSRAEYDRRYRSWRPKFAGSPPAVRRPALRNLLLWGLGTYVVARFLLLPALAHPFIKLLLLVGVVFFLIWFYKTRKAP